MSSSDIPKILGSYFDGAFHLPSTSGPGAVEIVKEKYSPTDLERKLWDYPIDYEHVEKILESAKSGFNKWKNSKESERKDALKRFQELLISKRDQIAEILSLEVGSPLKDSKADIDKMVEFVDLVIDESLPKIKTQINKYGTIKYCPIGVCLVIGSEMQSVHSYEQIFSSIIAGNSIIFKSCLEATLSSQLVIECFHNAKFPKGVINYSSGDIEISKRLIKSRTIKGVFYNGNKEEGRDLVDIAQKDLSKNIYYNFKGKNVCIVDKDVDLDDVISSVIDSCFKYGGQRFSSAEMVLVHDDIKDEFLSKLHEQTKKIIVDHPLLASEMPFLGSLVNRRNLDSYLLFIGMAKREGIKEVMRGKALDRDIDGLYVAPSIHYAYEMDRSSHFLNSIILGPNCTVIKYRDEKEVVDLISSFNFGPIVSIFSKNKEVIDEIMTNLDVGQINVNRGTLDRLYQLPFSGDRHANFNMIGVNTIMSSVYEQSIYNNKE